MLLEDVMRQREKGLFWVLLLRAAIVLDQGDQSEERCAEYLSKKACFDDSFETLVQKFYMTLDILVYFADRWTWRST